MNYIRIFEPRWHDRTILIASWKIGSINQIVIDHHEFTNPYYITGEQIKQYPTTFVNNSHGFKSLMYVVPLSALSTDLVLQAL